MLQPKRSKFRKLRKGRIKRYTSAHCAAKQQHSFGVNTDLTVGQVALRSLEGGRLTARQLEAARRIVRRKLQRQGRLFTQVFPNMPVTQKASDSRMGKGKGNVTFWVAKIKPGQIIFELEGLITPMDYRRASTAFSSAGHKLPLKTVFCSRYLLSLVF